MSCERSNGMSARLRCAAGSWLLAVWGSAACGSAPDAPDACALAPTARALLADDSIGPLVVSGDGRLAAALTRFDWVNAVGDLVTVDLSTEAVANVASRVSPPVVFVAGDTAVLYPSGITAVYGDGWATRNLQVYFPATGRKRDVAADVVAFAVSAGGRHLAYFTPTETIVHDLDTGVTRPLAGGQQPCTFTSDSGFACLPLWFSPRDRLFFVAQLGDDGGVLSAADAGAAAVEPLADGVVDYRLAGGGAVLVHLSRTTFDPTCACVRGDLGVTAASGEPSRTLRTQAREPSLSHHVGVSPGGASVAFADPDRNPTTISLLSFGSGDLPWVEAEALLDTPAFLGETSALVSKPIFVGTRTDTAVEAISTADHQARVTVGEQVRKLGFDPAGQTLAVLQHPFSLTRYQGPSTVRLWSAEAGGVPSERATFALPAAPFTVHDRFDGAGRRIRLLLDEGEAGRGRLVVGSVEDSTVTPISASAWAHDDAWIAGGRWIAYVEDVDGGAAGPLRVADPIGGGAGLAFGTSVSALAEAPGACASILFTDCAGPAPAAACRDAAPGLYLLRLAAPP